MVLAPSDMAVRHTWFEVDSVADIVAKMARTFLEVDPRELRLPSGRAGGADPYKLQMQIAKFGASATGMPPILVFEGTDGKFSIVNGVTRAMRIAKLAPGTLVRVEVISKLRRAYATDPKIGDFIP